MNEEINTNSLLFFGLKNARKVVESARTSGYSFKTESGLAAKLFRLDNPKMGGVRKALERGEKHLQGEPSKIYAVDVKLPKHHIYCVCYYQTLEFTLDSFQNADLMFTDAIHHVIYKNQACNPFGRAGRRLVMAISVGASPNIVPLIASENQMQWWK